MKQIIVSIFIFLLSIKAFSLDSKGNYLMELITKRDINNISLYILKNNEFKDPLYWGRANPVISAIENQDKELTLVLIKAGIPPIYYEEETSSKYMSIINSEVNYKRIKFLVDLVNSGYPVKESNYKGYFKNKSYDAFWIFDYTLLSNTCFPLLMAYYKTVGEIEFEKYLYHYRISRSDGEDSGRISNNISAIVCDYFNESKEYNLAIEFLKEKSFPLAVLQYSWMNKTYSIDSLNTSNDKKMIDDGIFDYESIEKNNYSFKGIKIAVNDNDVRIRVAPSSSSKILGVLSRGNTGMLFDISFEKEKIDGDQFPWAKIKFDNGVWGWVYAKYIDPEVSIEDLFNRKHR